MALDSTCDCICEFVVEMAMDVDSTTISCRVEESSRTAFNSPTSWAKQVEEDSQGRIKIVEAFDVDSMKTSGLVSKLKELEVGRRPLIVTEDATEGGGRDEARQ